MQLTEHYHLKGRVSCDYSQHIHIIPHRRHHVSATKPNRLMLCGETVAVCCENRTEHTYTIHTSQEAPYVSAREPNRLMLCGETVAVCCENRTEHTDTVRTSQETHDVSTTEPNRLMLCGDSVAVCCENRTEHTDTVRTSQETQIHCGQVQYPQNCDEEALI
jgi:hypothetical protein